MFSVEYPKKNSVPRNLKIYIEVFFKNQSTYFCVGFNLMYGMCTARPDGGFCFWKRKKFQLHILV